MKNPKSETRNPREVRGPKTESGRLGAREIGRLKLSVLHYQFPLAVALVLASEPAMRAQSYSLDWSSLAGGGGDSSGGAYSLAGALGQSDVGPMSGGSFTLEGGFGTVVATTQNPGTPSFKVLRQGNLLRIAWTKLADGWVLESTSALLGPALSWAPVAQTYQDDGDSLYITINPTSGSAFFRLRMP